MLVWSTLLALPSGVHINASPEVGVTSTKAYTSAYTSQYIELHRLAFTTDNTRNSEVEKTNRYSRDITAVSMSLGYLFT